MLRVTTRFRWVFLDKDWFAVARVQSDIWSSVQKNVFIPSDTPLKKPPIRVFILDDHPIFADVLAEVLDQSGDFTVVGSANDGETALKRLEGLSVEIVILDLVLPGMGGLEVVDALRANRSKARLVICSGLGSENAIMCAYAAGVSAFVEKSMALDDLLSTLRAVVKGDFPLNQRISGLLRDCVRNHKALKPVSGRDMKMLRDLATGQSLKEIAGELKISVAGAYKARARIKSRMNIKGPSGFFQIAFNLGLIYPTAAPVLRRTPLVGRGLCTILS